MNSESKNSDDFLFDKTLADCTDLSNYLAENKYNYQNSFKEVIKNYVFHLNDILQLHNGLKDIASTIDNVEETLNHFQINLKSISSEMLGIQTKCTQINTDLQDRQTIKRRLTTVIDKLVISERMISVISSTLVTNQEFIEQLHELSYKLTIMEDIRKLNTVASEETYQLIINLKNACLKRLNEYILSQIYLCNRPLNDCESVKQNLVKHGYLLKFIKEIDMFTYESIFKEYINVMTKNYNIHLKTYGKRITEFLKVDGMPNQNDLIGLIPSSKNKFFKTANQNLNKEQYYTVGNRATVISSEIENDVISPSSNGAAKLSIENIFRSMHYLLINNCTAEYYFLSDFFCLGENSALSSINDLLGQSIQLYIELSEDIINKSFDCIGLLLCSSLFHRYSFLTKKRSLSILNDYFFHMCQFTWNRFVTVIESHIQSIRNISSPTPSLCDECHIITKRCSNLFSLFYSVVGDFNTSQLILIFSSFLQEWETFLLIQASQFTIRTEQLIYHIVNYNVILNLLSAQPSISIVTSQCNVAYICKESYDMCKEIEINLRKKYDDLITQACTEELLRYFGNLITFVKNKKISPDKSTDNVEILSISKLFAYEWKRSMSVINDNIKKGFSGSFIDREIVENCFTILIDYYSEFKKYITTNHKSIANDLNDKGLLVDVQQVMVEAKKYK